MDLIDRYLQAVRFWLPRKGQDDLVAELSEDLRCQVEEAEAGLGRALDKAETAAILRRTGEPLKVAARCLDQGPLLDPALAMIYRLVVKIVLLWILLPLTVLTTVPSLLLGHHPLGSLTGGILSYAFSAIMALGCITLVFTLVGGTWKGSAAPARPWDPLRLPPVRPRGGARPTSRARSVFDVVFGLLFAGWWSQASTRVPLAWSTLTGPVWSAGPLWADFHGRWYYPVLALTLLNVAATGLSLARPHWVRFRLAWSAVSNLLVAAMCAATFVTHRPAILASLRALGGAGGHLQDAAGLGALIDGLVAASLLVAVMACLAGAFAQGVKCLRTSPVQ